MKKKLRDFVKTRCINFPLYLYKNRKVLGLSFGAFVFLMYLLNAGEKVFFDLKLFSEELGDTDEEIMSYINELVSKDMIELVSEKHEKGYLEEYILLNNFYDLFLDIISKTEDEGRPEIFEFIEAALGRVLSARDYDIIKSWIASDVDDAVIKKGVTEAMKVGNSNINYIDRIIFNLLSEEVEEEEESEIFDYDWLNE